MIKKLLITTALLAVSIPAQAKSCYDALTQNNKKDSYAFQLNERDLGDADVVGLELATTAVKSLVAKLRCTDQPKIDHRASACQEIIPGNPTSEVCFVATDLGHFVISVDYLDHINLVFNRID